MNHLHDLLRALALDRIVVFPVIKPEREHARHRLVDVFGAAAESFGEVPAYEEDHSLASTTTSARSFRRGR